jgi:hypothetical protein
LGERFQLTFPFDFLVYLRKLRTAIHLLVSLERQLCALSRATEDAGASIHGALQGIAFPAEEVVAVLAVSSPEMGILLAGRSLSYGRRDARVTHAQNVRLLASLRPKLVELLRVPHGLKEQSGDVDGVRGGAGAVGHEYPELRVDVLVEGYVAL